MTNAELAENLRAIAECVDDWYFPLGSKSDLWEAARRLEDIVETKKDESDQIMTRLLGDK